MSSQALFYLVLAALFTAWTIPEWRAYFRAREAERRERREHRRKCDEPYRLMRSLSSDGRGWSLAPDRDNHV